MNLLRCLKLSPISQNLTEIQGICKLDIGKVLWNWLYANAIFMIFFYDNNSEAIVWSKWHNEPQEISQDSLHFFLLVPPKL